MLSTLGAAVAFGATLLLVIVDPRQTARRRAFGHRGRVIEAGQWETVVTKVDIYRRPGPFKRALAALGLAGLSVGAGFVLATALAGTLFFAALWLRDAIR
jgi:hypothetical protein